MTRESTSVKVAALTERLSNFMDVSRERHNELLTKVDTLCDKVNHQYTYQEKRIRNLENKQIAEVNKYKGRMELFKWATIALSVIVSCLTICQIFNVI